MDDYSTRRVFYENSFEPDNTIIQRIDFPYAE